MTHKIQGIEVRIYGTGMKYAVGIGYDKKPYIKNVPVWSEDMEETLYNTPEQAVKALRIQWAAKLESLIGARDKAKMWASVLDNREDMVNAARLLRGGFDLNTPGITKVMADYMGDHTAA